MGEPVPKAGSPTGLPFICPLSGLPPSLSGPSHQLTLWAVGRAVLLHLPVRAPSCLPPQSPDMYVPCHFPFIAEETKAQRGSATTWRPHDKGAGRTQTQIRVTLKRTPSDRRCCFSTADVQGPLFRTLTDLLPTRRGVCTCV